MSSHEQVSNMMNMQPVINELAANAHLFGEFNARKSAEGSPHAQMDDIWLRYGDVSAMIESGDYSKIADEHDSIWLQALPACRKICFDVMALVRGERLGGVLITRLPPGGKITPHTDAGWHAAYYDKYFVPVQNKPGATFGFFDGEINPAIGDVWKFNNSVPHWVNNDSNEDRIAMIICIKGER